MRYRHWEKKKLDWERWFAWYPIPIGGYPCKDETIMVWLELVERKWLDNREGNSSYNYRLLRLSKPVSTSRGCNVKSST